MPPDQAIVIPIAAAVRAERLIWPFSRPISGVSGKTASRGPGGVHRRVASFGGIPAGRAAAGLANRFGGGTA